MLAGSKVITGSVLKRIPEGQAAFRLREDQTLLIASGKGNSDRHIFPFNVHRTALMRHIPDSKSIDAQDLVFLGYMLYLFTLRLMFNRRIKKLSRLDKAVVDTSRDSIFASFDLVRYKIATMKCLIRKLNPQKHFAVISDVFESCGLSREDSILYCLAYYNGDLTEFVKMMGTCPDERFVVECDTLRNEVNSREFLKEVKNSSSYFSMQKMSFIAKGNRYSITDLQQDLLLRATQAYYWVRPFYGKLHAVNYAKSAIHGWTQCLIEHYTDESRARTRSDGQGGYENTIVEMTDDVHPNGGILEDHLIHLIDIKRMINRPDLTVEEVEGLMG